jgi:predicted lipid-binding transport protein (Tim44 family)
VRSERYQGADEPGALRQREGASRPSDSQGSQDVLADIDLQGATIIGVADNSDGRPDEFWVHVQGSIVDYVADDSTGAAVSGDPSEAEEFAQIWKFVRDETGWVADEIHPKARRDSRAH